MNVLIASDKFKDACSAEQVGQSLQTGIKKTYPEANITVLPLADGGEGTLEALATSLGATWIETETKDPLFRKINATYLYQESESRAIIEMSRASGFELLEAHERNCMFTSSLGTGLQIVDALNKGAKEIVLTVGGTATNDAALGIAFALGVQFLDMDGKMLCPTGENLVKIYSIDFSNSIFNKNTCKFKIATDVENPFYGPKGAAFVFAAQKGAGDKEIEHLDAGLKNICNIFEKQGLPSPALVKGSGAGGGVSGGLYALFEAEIFSAADWILELNSIDEILKNTDVLITGEGKVDSQTWDGKLISRLLHLAHKNQTKSVIMCGTLANIEQIPTDMGIVHVSSIIHKPMSLAQALADTKKLLIEHGMLLGHYLKNNAK
jgi:glycerate 2-kinase